jgi:hypothetical protein
LEERRPTPILFASVRAEPAPGARARSSSELAENNNLLPMNLDSLKSCRCFPLSPSEGERVGERGSVFAWKFRGAKRVK